MRRARTSAPAYEGRLGRQQPAAAPTAASAAAVLPYWRLRRLRRLRLRRLLAVRRGGGAAAALLVRHRLDGLRERRESRRNGHSFDSKRPARYCVISSNRNPATRAQYR